MTVEEVRTRRLGPGFWRLWTSSGLSNLADSIAGVGLPLMAIQYTRSPVLISGLAFALTLPWLLFALPAGALADRLDRRRAMLVANAVRGGLLATLALAVAFGAGSIWLLYAVALGIGIAETMYDTSAQALLPQLVPGDRLSRANGRLYAVELTANEFAGPPLAGFLVATGTAVVFAAPAALWAVAIGALLLVRGSFRIERAGRTTMRADIAEGLRFLWRHRVLRTFAVMTGVINFATTATFALLVLYAVGPASAMALSAQAFGALLAAIAVGSLVGSFAADRVERRLGRGRALLVSIVLAALMVGVLALTANPFVIGAAFFAGGTGIVVWNVIAVSLRQRVTPPRLLGRVNSGHRLVAWGSRPLSAAACGPLAEVFGLRLVFGVLGLLILTLLAGVLVVTDEAMADAERAADG